MPSVISGRESENENKNDEIINDLVPLEGKDNDPIDNNNNNSDSSFIAEAILQEDELKTVVKEIRIQGSTKKQRFWRDL